MFLHGFLGRGANWRSVARKLVEARPEWGAVLVDLRLHGRSQDLPPPHTLDAVTGDLEQLVTELDRAGRPVHAVVGHSFGGKAALAYRARAGAGASVPALLDTWVLDSSPSARPGALDDADPPADSPVRVLRALAALPDRFAARADFVATLTARGLSRPVADWLAMNLERVEPPDHGMRLPLDPAALTELLADYFARDLWSAVAVAPGGLPGAVHVVVGGRSPAVPTDERARFRAAGAEVEVLPDAGHWLNLDAASALIRLMTDRLPPPP